MATQIGLQKAYGIENGAYLVGLLPTLGNEPTIEKEYWWYVDTQENVNYIQDFYSPTMESNSLVRLFRDIELAFIFGIASKSEFWTTTGGIKYSIDKYAPQNALTGEITLQAFSAWLYNICKVGSDTKVLFAGSNAFKAILDLASKAANGYRVEQGSYVRGLSVRNIDTPTGAIGLIEHPMLTEIPAFNNFVFAIDLQHIAQKELQPITSDGNICSAKLGLKLKHPAAHGYGIINTEIK